MDRPMADGGSDGVTALNTPSAIAAACTPGASKTWQISGVYASSSDRPRNHRPASSVHHDRSAATELPRMSANSSSARSFSTTSPATNDSRARAAVGPYRRIASSRVSAAGSTTRRHSGTSPGGAAYRRTPPPPPVTGRTRTAIGPNRTHDTSPASVGICTSRPPVNHTAVTSGSVTTGRTTGVA